VATLQIIEKDVDEIITHLSLAMQILQQKVVDQVHGDIKSLLSKITSIGADSKTARPPKWLKAPDIAFHSRFTPRRAGTLIFKMGTARNTTCSNTFSASSKEVKMRSNVG